MSDIKILGPNGQPLPPTRSKASMLVGGSRVPYDAADSFSDQLANWQPALWSPDNEINIYRDRIVSRVRDLARNDGWASGSITRVLDNAIGANFRPILKPDYRMLALMTGNKAFDATWADEYGKVIEAHWRSWAQDDPGRYCDVERKQTVSQMLRLGFRHKLIDGDALAVLQYRPDRLGRGRGRYATTVQIVDPDRLSNPQQNFDMPNIRGGVEIDGDGAPVAYHIREAHIGDWWSGAKTMTWQRIPRETDWGRPHVVHDYDHERGAQHRGNGILTPVVQRLKMLIKYDQTELEAAILNAVFGAYITSPYDPQMVEAAMGENFDDTSIGAYQDGRVDFHRDRRISLQNGARMPILYPGEDVKAVNAARPHSNFEVFESAALRNIAAATGLSTQQVTQDWSDVNYSSARSAMLEAWKTLTRRRDDFSAGFAQPILSAFIEEIHDTEDLPLPNGAPHFLDARAAYCRARWMGPGRGWVDPVAEKKGAILGMDAGLSTLEMEAAENAGEDWEEMLDQRKREIDAFKERGLPLPTWAQAEIFAPETIKDPEAE
ncbi:TPA: phage portal protein [Serratia liquefaciens]|uniref:phage portal protein n=1 Tax=Serratia grimesii TaxID=82995 RepID=UPI002178825C|nr:phage portal protein [Serratia grimesii]CAI1502718.1 phage portal protein, lambda family [Serratia grimesii]HEI8952772.1 phage portal protein [Serratia liquefaciens]